jgi:hypothetical protein
MPDTGAPWNLPYPAPTDLVRDGAQNFEDLADAVALGLTAANVGIGTNVVSATLNTPFTMSSTTFADLLSVTITPSSATSKVLLIAHLTGHGQAGTTQIYARFVQNSTVISVGGAEGTRTRATTNFGFDASNTAVQQSASAAFLDSPATDLAVTYKVQVAASASGSIFINRTQGNADTPTQSRTVSSLTAIEVAA